MEIFLDTANIDEIRHGVRMGVVSGVTTNPSLASQEGIGDLGDYRETVQEIARVVDGPVSAEVLSTHVDGMLSEGREIATWASNVVVKLPSTTEGLEAISTLSREGIAINQTLCFSVTQALLGARAGATFVSPFVGRLDDASHVGMDVVRDIVQVFQLHKIRAKVLAASIRHPLHCVEAAKAGASIATIPFKVLMQMMQHPLTDVGITRFAQDWQKAVRL